MLGDDAATDDSVFADIRIRQRAESINYSSN
jgi:hypothetical protein